jgi:hypothetical protein
MSFRLATENDTRQVNPVHQCSVLPPTLPHRPKKTEEEQESQETPEPRQENTECCSLRHFLTYGRSSE